MTNETTATTTESEAPEFTQEDVTMVAQTETATETATEEVPANVTSITTKTSKSKADAAARRQANEERKARAGDGPSAGPPVRGGPLVARHSIRDRSTGRYEATPPCEVCGRPGGYDYRSLPTCNEDGIGLTLCSRPSCPATKTRADDEVRALILERDAREAKSA